MAKSEDKGVRPTDVPPEKDEVSGVPVSETFPDDTADSLRGRGGRGYAGTDVDRDSAGGGEATQTTGDRPSKPK